MLSQFSDCSGTFEYLFIIYLLITPVNFVFNYSTPFQSYPRAERRKQHQLFRCTCDACKHNFPKLEDLPWSPIEMPATIDVQKLSQRMKRKEALKAFPIIADHLQKIHKFIPCKDWALLTEAFMSCARTLYSKEDQDFVYATTNYVKYADKYKPDPFSSIFG